LLTERALGNGGIRLGIAVATCACRQDRAITRLRQLERARVLKIVVSGMLYSKSMDLSLGPELGLGSAPVSAKLDGQEVFEIPQFTIGVAIELGMWL
jgi:hypothetical protein